MKANRRPSELMGLLTQNTQALTASQLPESPWTSAKCLTAVGEMYGEKELDGSETTF